MLEGTRADIWISGEAWGDAGHAPDAINRLLHEDDDAPTERRDAGPDIVWYGAAVDDGDLPRTSLPQRATAMDNGLRSARPFGASGGLTDRGGAHDASFED